jgi:hypothetical protein
VARRGAHVADAVSDQVHLQRLRHHLGFSQIGVQEAAAEVPFATVRCNHALDAFGPSLAERAKHRCEVVTGDPIPLGKGNSGSMLRDRLEHYAARRIGDRIVGPREQGEHRGLSRNHPLGVRAKYPAELHQAMNRVESAQTIDSANHDEPVRAAAKEVRRGGQGGKRARASVWKPRGLRQNGPARRDLLVQSRAFVVIEVGRHTDHQGRILHTDGGEQFPKIDQRDACQCPQALDPRNEWVEERGRHDGGTKRVLQSRVGEVTQARPHRRQRWRERVT